MEARSTLRSVWIPRQLMFVVSLLVAFALGAGGGLIVWALTKPAAHAVHYTAPLAGHGSYSDLTRALPAQSGTLEGHGSYSDLTRALPTAPVVVHVSKAPAAQIHHAQYKGGRRF